jgi:membrane protease YdiL (CAAX protease family)
MARIDSGEEVNANRYRTITGSTSVDVAVGLFLWYATSRAVILSYALGPEGGVLAIIFVGVAFITLHYYVASESEVTGLWQTSRKPSAVRDVLHLVPLRLRPHHLVLWVLGFGLFQAGLFGVLVYTRVFQPGMTLALTLTGERGWIWHGVFIFFGAVFEEFPLRGWVQGSIAQRFGAAAGVILASFVFAVGHSVPYGGPIGLWVGPLVLGLLAGTAVYLTGSIWAAVLIHAQANVLAVLCSTALASGYYAVLPGGDFRWLGAFAVTIIGAASMGLIGARVRASRIVYPPAIAA